MSGLNIDVRARKTAQAALGESEANFRFTFEHATVGVAHVAPDGRFLSVNRYLCDFLGLSEAELVETTFQDLTHRDDLEPDLDLARRMLAGELDSYALEKRYVRPDGEIVWADLSVSLRRGADGAPANFISIVSDARPRKAAEERLRRLNAELEARVAERTATLREAAEALRAEMVRREEAQAQLQQAQKMEALGRLVGGVAHDFNNVLAAIQAAFNLLDRRLDDPSMKFIVDEGRKAGERAADLVRQMLAFARREAVTPQPVDLATSLPALTPMLRHALGARVTCELEVAEDVWPVLVDKTQLEIALLNLAVNAADAMPEGGDLTIRALNVGLGEPVPANLAAGEYVRIDVSDTGLGMAEAVLRRMFEPFFTTKAPGRGTGLGLAQVHGFAEMVGGSVVAVSTPGRGTTVSLHLPRSVIAEGLKAGEAAGSELHGGAAILLVDDDNQVRPVTAAYLRDLGYSVIEAGSGGAALALIQLYPVDLLITDVIMPGIDGEELAGRLRAEKPDLAVLFMTGRADQLARAADVVLEKPFTGEGLADHVLRALGRRG